MQDPSNSAFDTWEVGPANDQTAVVSKNLWLLLSIKMCGFLIILTECVYQQSFKSILLRLIVHKLNIE